MSVVTLSLAKRYIQVTHASDDALIQLLLDSVEAWLATHLGFAWTETERIDFVDGGGITLWPFTHPIITVSEVYDMTTSSTIAATAYNLRRNTQVVRYGEARWLKGRGRWRVTYDGGYAGGGASSIAIPPPLKMLVLEFMVRAYNNRGGMTMQSTAGFSTTWQNLAESDMAKQLREYDWTRGIR